MQQPIDMILPCPKCGWLHVDAPEPEKGWYNPPHKSHLCHRCGVIWRPADVPTNGVAQIKTRGLDDTWTHTEGRGYPRPWAVSETEGTAYYDAIDADDAWRQYAADVGEEGNEDFTPDPTEYTVRPASAKRDLDVLQGIVSDMEGKVLELDRQLHGRVVVLNGPRVRNDWALPVAPEGLVPVVQVGSEGTGLGWASLADGEDGIDATWTSEPEIQWPFVNEDPGDITPYLSGFRALGFIVQEY